MYNQNHTEEDNGSYAGNKTVQHRQIDDVIVHSLVYTDHWPCIQRLFA